MESRRRLRGRLSPSFVIAHYAICYRGLLFTRYDSEIMSDQAKVTKAVIPAAGLGTRMLPATKAIPKEMLPVAGKPLIEYAVEEAVAAGIETVILVIRKHESLI